jgi:hypothetical protein
MNKDRIEMIRNYYRNQKVKVEIPVVTTKTYRGETVIHRFNGERAGIQFVDGFATVSREDAEKLKQHFPYIIIHENKGGEA